MMKKLLAMVMALFVLFLSGCDFLDLFSEDDIEYETATPALIDSFNDVGGALGNDMENAADSADSEGNVYYSNTGITISGSFSAEAGDTTTSISMMLSMVYSDYNYSDPDIDVVLDGYFNLDMEILSDNDTNVDISGSGEYKGKVTLSGADFTELEMNVSWTVTNDVYDYSGYICIDGVYYHPEDFFDSDDDV